MTTYNDMLSEEFSRRTAHNARYSQRAFARDLGISQPFLSQVQTRRRRLSEERAWAICQRIGWQREQRDLFVRLVRLDGVRDLTQQRELHEEIRKNAPHKLKIRPLNEDTFNIIADWYHYALLELTTVEDFQNDTRWIAERLGISMADVDGAIRRLRRVGLLLQTADGFRKTEIG